MHRLMISVPAAILLVLVPGVVLAKSEFSIPKKRLRDGVYTSPAGEFTLKIPRLITPGAKSEERQVGPGGWAVFFTDDFGHVYFVLKSDNRSPRKTIEEITSDIEVGDTVRSKVSVATSRGTEVRVAGVVKNGSPITSVSEVAGKKTEKQLDLVKVSSLFLHDDDAYEVTVGLTRLHDDQADDDLLGKAKAELETFLSGLTLQGR